MFTVLFSWLQQSENWTKLTKNERAGVETQASLFNFQAVLPLTKDLS